MRPMRRGVVSLALVGATLFASGAIAAGDASFADTAGDGGAAPDVTDVTVANDDKGLLTFHVTVANRSALGPDDVIAVLLSTDDPDLVAGQRNDGINYILAIDAQGVTFLEWTGFDMEQVDPRPASVTGSFASGVATITVKQEDLAPGFPDLSVPIRMDFYVLGILFKGNDVAAQDDAPDGAAVWSYKISEPLRLIVTNFDADKTVKAGKTLVVLMGAAHGDTGAAVRKGKVTCRARLGGKPLPGKGKFITVSV